MIKSGGINELVRSLRKQLREQRAEIRQMHQRGLSGPKASAKLAAMIDAVVVKLFHRCLEDLSAAEADKLRANVALLALGSYGRRQSAPFSDVDLMILYTDLKPEELVVHFRPLTQGVFDVGLQLGHSVRTEQEAVRLAKEDPVICTSLIDARLLIGNQAMYDSFRASFQRMMQRNSKSLCRTILDARTEERNEFGETVYLLEPHVKRSRGGLRDLQMTCWLGFAEHGTADPDRLHLLGTISKFDHRRLLLARDFLLRLRNEMHFHADKSRDLLDRAEQMRVAEWLGHKHRNNLLPVEHFMRDYFRHTNHLWQLVRRRAANLDVENRVFRVLDPVFTRTFDGDFRVGPQTISASSNGAARLKKDLGEVLRLVELSVSKEKLIEHSLWSELLMAAPEHSDQLSPEDGEQFLEILADPQIAGKVVSTLHQLGYLEKFIPAMRHARYLLQFNQYHKYTVDEHCLRAVRMMEEFDARTDRLGKAYRAIDEKRTLHLALLLHDLGKGYEEDHSEIGRRLAEETAKRLGLSEEETDQLVFLVHKHLMMSHFAFRRDTSDMDVLRQFAESVGSVERLRMLFVLTCADLGAVGPGVLNDWKIDVLHEVFINSSKLLDGNGVGVTASSLESFRQEILAALSPAERSDTRLVKLVEALPPNYLAACDIKQLVETLRKFQNLPARQGVAWCHYNSQLKTLEFTAGVDQGTGRGIFAAMAGTLASKGMQILSASTDVLPDNFLMFRFVANDINSAGAPGQQRLTEICRALENSIDSQEKPKFPRRWGQEKSEASSRLSPLPNEVRIDSHLSTDYTIVEVFTFDRIGLLYTLARKLHELGMIIGHAKIGTYLDQVVDVFYITNQQHQKVTDSEKLEGLREELMRLIEE